MLFRIFQNIWSQVPKRFSSCSWLHTNRAVPGKTVSTVLDGAALFINESGKFNLYFFAFQLRLCGSNGYLEVIFHALDVFSIIFATVYVEVKIGACMDAILSASAIYMY